MGCTFKLRFKNSLFLSPCEFSSCKFFKVPEDPYSNTNQEAGSADDNEKDQTKLSSSFRSGNVAQQGQRFKNFSKRVGNDNWQKGIRQFTRRSAFAPHTSNNCSGGWKMFLADMMWLFMRFSLVFKLPFRWQQLRKTVFFTGVVFAVRLGR